jgi:hypothetical protein
MSNTLWPAPVQSKIELGCKIPHELDALKWKATGRRRRHFTYPRQNIINTHRIDTIQ